MFFTLNWISTGRIIVLHRRSFFYLGNSFQPQKHALTIHVFFLITDAATKMRANQVKNTPYTSQWNIAQELNEMKKVQIHNLRNWRRSGITYRYLMFYQWNWIQRSEICFVSNFLVFSFHHMPLTSFKCFSPHNIIRNEFKFWEFYEKLTTKDNCSFQQNILYRKNCWYWRE